ncbi:MAG TPA: hypothetical protein VJB90_05485 [Candidatus Nanoarchaeia archaeon]|nr:hypothetical protein [Candidatus Nanoarchaeia archaeon]
MLYVGDDELGAVEKTLSHYNRFGNPSAPIFYHEIPMACFGRFTEDGFRRWIRGMIPDAEQPLQHYDAVLVHSLHQDMVDLVREAFPGVPIIMIGILGTGHIAPKTADCEVGYNYRDIPSVLEHMVANK